MTEEKIGLTPVQKDIYDFLCMFHQVHGYMPTLKEIADGKIEERQILAARKSKNTIVQILDNLAQKKWIVRNKGFQRGLQVL
jgi:SOS-response transcriptional repressor LexA